MSKSQNQSKEFSTKIVIVMYHLTSIFWSLQVKILKSATSNVLESRGEGSAKATANITVEVIARSGAQVKFAAIDRLGEKLLPTLAAEVN